MTDGDSIVSIIIRFKTEDYWDAGKKVEKIQGRLLGLKSSVVSASKQLKFSEDVMQSYDEKAVNEAKKLDGYADKCGVLASWYFFTAETFEAVENEITRSIINRKRVFGNISSSGTEINNDLDEYTFQTEVKDNYANQEKVREILQKEEYSEEKWDKMSVEERKQLMEKLFKEVSEILGVEGISLVFTTPETDPDMSVSTNGYNSDSKKCIAINEDKLDDDGSYDRLRTIVHELRHAYQHDVVNNPDKYKGKVSQKTIDVWTENFKPENYKKSGDDYLAQPVEYDASSFAEQHERHMKTDENGNPYTIKPEYDGGWPVWEAN